MVRNGFESLRVNISNSMHFWPQYTLYKVVEWSRSEISEDRVYFGGSNQNRVKLEEFLALFRASQSGSQILVFGKSPFQGDSVFSFQLSKLLKETQTVSLRRSRKLWWQTQR